MGGDLKSATKKIQDDYVAYGRLKKDLLKFKEEISHFTIQDYKDKRQLIHNTITQAETLQKQIDFQCGELENMNLLSSSDKNTALKTKKEIESKMSSCVEQVNEAIEIIQQEERKRFGTVESLSSSTTQEENRPREPSLSQDFKILTIQKNEEVLKQRGKELNVIQQTAAQIKDLTTQMKTETVEQGEKLNQIEDHVININDNVEKANNEIKQANELNKKNRNKVTWLILIVVFVCLVIAGCIIWFSGLIH